MPPPEPTAWFLTRNERGNPDTDLDRRRRDGRAWTEGNAVEALVDGATYFRRLHAALTALPGDAWVHVLDWRGDADERLDGPGSEVGEVLAGLARRGVHVRGLVWRSHPHQTRFSEQEAIHLASVVNEAGGELLLDERVRRGGSHHQKLVLLRRPGHEDDDVAFVGGIDLCHGRNDDHRHLGDEQPYDMSDRYGDRPAWHDVQLHVRGPVIGDLAHTFRERWDDPTPLDHRNPLRAVMRVTTRQPRQPDPLPDMPDDPGPAGSASVQVLRTYPAKRPPFPFARLGERSIARAYGKAFARARRLIYVEDQYLWSSDVAGPLAEALAERPTLRLVAVVPRYPEEDGALSKAPMLAGHHQALDALRAAGGDRVTVYDLEAESGRPVYVHAKVCVVDDVWAAVGSDNLNRRSWTHDSELSCSILDAELDGREPVDPAGLGDGARRFARDLRIGLWAEHLGRSPSDPALVDPDEGCAVLAASAAALDRWHDGGRGGDRPPGRLRVHRPEPLPSWARWWPERVYRLAIDPDGRPRRLRRRGGF